MADVTYFKRETKKNGTVWAVRFRYDDGGETVRKQLSGFSTKKEAVRAYAEYFEDLEKKKAEKEIHKRGRPPKKKTEAPSEETERSTTSFGEAYRVFIDSRGGIIAPSMVYNTEKVFGAYILPDFKDGGIDITRADIVAWQDRMWNRKNEKTGKLFSQKYLINVRGYFTSFMRWAEDAYGIKNPFDGVRAPSRREPKKEMHVWTPEQFSVFIKAVDSELYRIFFRMLFYSGCRVGELNALTVDDLVKKDDRYAMTISKSCTRGYNGGGSVITPPKTSTSNRTVTLPEILTPDLDAFLEGRKGYVFGGETPLNAHRYERTFNAAIIKTDLPHIRIHDLRHSLASMLINNDVPITDVSKRLGHSTPKMTLDVYSHCYDSAEDDVASLLDDVMKKKK